MADRREDLRLVRDIARAAHRAPEALIERLELQLTVVLDLRSAAYRPGEQHAPMPRITGDGIVVPPGTPPLDRQRPDTWAVALPVESAERRIGAFILHLRHPSSGLALPAHRRELALALADQLAFGLSRAANDGLRRG